MKHTKMLELTLGGTGARQTWAEVEAGYFPNLTFDFLT